MGRPWQPYLLKSKESLNSRSRSRPCYSLRLIPPQAMSCGKAPSLDFQSQLLTQLLRNAFPLANHLTVDSFIHFYLVKEALSLLKMCQGACSIADYTIYFQTLAASFPGGLCTWSLEEVDIVACDPPRDLETLYSLTLCLDNISRSSLASHTFGIVLSAALLWGGDKQASLQVFNYSRTADSFIHLTS